MFGLAQSLPGPLEGRPVLTDAVVPGSAVRRTPVVRHAVVAGEPAPDRDLLPRLHRLVPGVTLVIAVRAAGECGVLQGQRAPRSPRSPLAWATPTQARPAGDNPSPSATADDGEDTS